MNKEIITLIDIAILEVTNYIKNYNLPEGHSLEKDTLKVLRLLRNEYIQNKGKINERVLRGFKDICTVTAIHYENSNFHNAIFNINDRLEMEIANYKTLELLRLDFGKGNPI